MEAKNFRIGNLLQSKEWGGKGIIEGIEQTENGFELKIKGFIHKCEKGKYFDFQGIKISDEYLIKLGFVRNESKGVVGFDESNENETTIYYDFGRITIVQWGLDTPFYFSNHMLRVELKYIHELQNLFFALKNKELSIETLM